MDTVEYRVLRKWRNPASGRDVIKQVWFSPAVSYRQAVEQELANRFISHFSNSLAKPLTDTDKEVFFTLERRNGGGWESLLITVAHLDRLPEDPKWVL